MSSTFAKHRKTALITGAATLALVLSGCGANSTGAGGGDAAGGDAPEKLVLGLVPSQEVDQLVLDADELGAQLSDELGIPVETNVTADYAALVTAMQSGQAQIGMFGPIALVQAADQAGAVPILQSVRYGSSTYVTQWFTNDPDRFCLDDVVMKDVDGATMSFCNGTDADEVSGPVGEDALKEVAADEAIAFVDAGSASGYYYPATQLQQINGIDPVDLSGASFAGGHPNAVQAVYDGDATVGTSFNDAREELVAETPDVGEKVTVFAWSGNIPNDGVAVAGDLSEEWQQKISDAFLAVADTEDDAAALDAVYQIDGLVPADLDALDAAREVEANFGEE